MIVDAVSISPVAELAHAVETSALAEGRNGVVGVGVDVVSVPRLSRLVSEGGQAFLDRGWTPDECAEADGDPERLATRWAVKEAVMKCLGLGISDLDPREMEVTSSESGAPGVVLRGAAGERAGRLGITKFHVSASHEDGWAVAIAVAARGQEDSEMPIQRGDRS